MRHLIGHGFLDMQRIAAGGFKNWDNLTVVAYSLEPGNMISFDHPFELNMSAWRGPGNSDFYNASDGFYNITLPGTAQGTKILLIAVAQKGNQIYLDFKNVTINSGAPREMNFTVTPALGNLNQWQLDKAALPPSQGETINITTKFVQFNFINESNSLMNGSMHVEVEFEYSDLTFSIMDGRPRERICEVPCCTRSKHNCVCVCS